MKLVVAFLSLMAITLTASADTMSEKFALSCCLGDRQFENTKDVTLSQSKTMDGGYVKSAELKMLTNNKIELNVRVLGNRLSISTIVDGKYIRVQGNQTAELELREEGAEGTDLIMTCNLK